MEASTSKKSSALGTPLRRGDVRADGYTYMRSYTNRNGTLCEQWLSPLGLHRYRLSITRNHAKKNAAEFGVPFDLTTDYLARIYPKDGLCPIFRTHMEYGGDDRDNSPSLDRLVPEQGYVRGNVAFISNRANQLKGRVSLPELERLVAHIKGPSNA
jgi:hypothetical protein